MVFLRFIQPHCEYGVPEELCFLKLMILAYWRIYRLDNKPCAIRLLNIINQSAFRNEASGGYRPERKSWEYP